MIDTPRLRLRRPVRRHHGPLHAMWADPVVMADLGPTKSRRESAAGLARNAGYAPLGFFAVERRADGATIGFCGLKPGAPDTPIAGMLEVGWMFAAPAWGQGYGFEAAAAAIAWGWQVRDDPVIVAITARRNVRSRALMARLGMSHDRNGDFWHPLSDARDPRGDTVTYRLARR